MSRSGPEVDAFGGVAGRLLRETMSLGTFASGCTVVLSVGTLAFILKSFNGSGAATALVPLAASLVLARFALNGYAGEWGGTVFSSRGGSWLAVAMVALRYAALSMVWIIPAVILGWRPEALQAAMGELAIGGHGGKLLALTVVVGILVTLSPPVFLIVSVGADRFLDLVDPAHWRRHFAGRQGDLHLVYALYLGALGFLAVVAGPVLIAAAVLNRDVALLTAFPVGGFAAGVALDLLGRLCGFFAATAADIDVSEPAPAPVPEPGPPDRPSVTVPLRPATATAGPASAGASAAFLPDTEVARVPRNPSGKTPLLDARERVDEQLRRFGSDPDGAIAALTELARDYAPQPLVLHALTVTLARAGRIDESLTRAREALPLCLERGALRLASGIYGIHLDRADVFSLSRDTALTLAQDLSKAGNLEAADAAYRRVLDRDPGERRAVKGSIQVAEAYVEGEGYAQARDVYRHLLETCPDSPLAQHMRDGIDLCDRRLAKAS